jgi:predicted nucleotidyltransferase component of viral defense system
MIPGANLTAWGQVVPWAEPKQVEQDLIISRAIVAIFSDPFLRAELRFRGGTALNKLHFPAPLRYSEDIDLVRTTAGPIGPLLDGIRLVLEPWLGSSGFDQSPVAPKLRFRVPAEEGGVQIRLKVEINTREITALDPPPALPFRVKNPWFTGETEVPTFSREEMLTTKLRALLQRNKGRDLFDLAHALDVFGGLNAARVVECFGLYLKQANQRISRAEAENRMFAKLANPAFLTDMRPLLPADQAEKLNEASTKAAFTKVFTHFIVRIPGEPWAKTELMKERFGLQV